MLSPSKAPRPAPKSSGRPESRAFGQLTMQRFGSNGAHLFMAAAMPGHKEYDAGTLPAIITRQRGVKISIEPCRCARARWRHILRSHVCANATHHAAWVRATCALFTSGMAALTAHCTCVRRHTALDASSAASVVAHREQRRRQRT